MSGSVSAPVNTRFTPIVEKLNTNERMLIAAIKNGDGDTVQSMINAGVKLNAIYAGCPGGTPLGLAIAVGNREMQQLLLSNGADVRGWRTEKGIVHSYLVHAAFDYDMGLLQYLHNWGANINETTNDGYLGVSILGLGPDSFSNKDNAMTALLQYHWKNLDDLRNADTKMVDMYSYLLGQGISPNFTPTSGDGHATGSVLTKTAQTGIVSLDFCIALKTETRRELVKMLLDAGANPNYKDSNGHTAVDYMLESGLWCPADIEGAKMVQSYMQK